jgi:hypothetical protein
MTDTWAPADGVIELPDGVRIRGRALRRPLAGGERPEFGLYLLGKEPPATAWDAAWIPWPDFRLPRDRAAARRALVDAHERARTQRVEIACGGGRGRTGTALACIATLAGVAPRDAVAYVRTNYHHRAVETPWQKRFVQAFRAQP